MRMRPKSVFLLFRLDPTRAEQPVPSTRAQGRVPAWLSAATNKGHASVVSDLVGHHGRGVWKHGLAWPCRQGWSRSDLKVQYLFPVPHLLLLSNLSLHFSLPPRLSSLSIWLSLAMRPSVTLLALAASIGITTATLTTTPVRERALEYVVKPKVFIISMFTPEADVWYGIPEFDLLALNITVPGFSPLFQDAHCTADGDVCQLTTGESEINAATTVASLVRCPRFDLTETYFMIAGIAGVNPEVATIASVTFARYAVQVALQYEFDQLDLPSNYTTGEFTPGFPQNLWPC